MLIGSNRYRLIETVGQGGMGRVWRARDEVLGREVAVKQLLISPQLDDAARRSLIQRAVGEARAVARLQHSNIVTVHDIVEHEDAPWIVMEFIDGPSLGAMITGDERPEWRKVAAIGAQVADALAHAHAAGVVHRDLKPDNILLDGDRPVITDFGIARLLDSTTHLTSTHSVVGTAQYMSPEQLQGQEVTGACDIWALGATLFAVLEGKAPFDGPTLTSIITAVLTEPLSQLTNAGPLTDLLSDLLEKDLERRPSADATAARLREALHRIDEPTEILASSEPTPGDDRMSQKTTVVPVPEIPTMTQPSKPRFGLSRRRFILGGTGLAVVAAGGTVAALLSSGSHAAAWTSVSLAGYAGSVNSIAFSPDGKTLVGGCNDHSVRLWDVATGANIATLTGHTDAVWVVAFSPDGKLIASGGMDQTVRIWNTSSHVAVTTVLPYVEVDSLAFSPDGNTLATSGQAHSVSLWDLTNGYAYIEMLFGSNLGGYAIAYSPNGRIVADGGLEKNVVLFDSSSYKKLGTINVDSELGATDVVFSPDSKTLATANFPVNSKKGSMASVVQLFDVATRTATATLSGHRSIVRSVAFSPDGTTLASGSDDTTVRLWDVATSRMTHNLSVPGGARSVAFSPDGSMLAVGAKTSRLWRL